MSRTADDGATGGPLADRVLRVWTCPVARPAVVIEAWTALLARDERERAARFRFDHDRERFIAAHAQLRAVLAGLTGRPARALTLVAGDHGKPRLADPAPCGLEFNLAHSGDLALVAAAHGAPVGVDVERARPLADAPAVAARILTPAERAEFAGLAAGDQADFVLSRWVRKEAFLKAIGTGLAIEPDTVALRRETGKNAWTVLDRDGTGWSVYELPVPTGYHAAVAARGRGWHVTPVGPPAPEEP